MRQKEYGRAKQCMPKIKEPMVKTFYFSIGIGKAKLMSLLS